MCISILLGFFLLLCVFATIKTNKQTNYHRNLKATPIYYLLVLWVKSLGTAELASHLEALGKHVQVHSCFCQNLGVLYWQNCGLHFPSSVNEGQSLILKATPCIFSRISCGPSSNGRLISSHVSDLTGPSFCSISLALAGEISLLLRADVIRLGPLAKIQDNFFIVKSIILITSSVSLLPCNVAYSHVPEEYGHLQRTSHSPTIQCF